MFKKAVLVLAVLCIALVTLVGCGADLSALESKLNEQQSKITALEQEKDAQKKKIDALEKDLADLEKELEERTTIFHDWANPIIVEDLDVFNAMAFLLPDMFQNLYHNKVVQVTGKIVDIDHELVYFENVIYHEFQFLLPVSDLEIGQTITVKGLLWVWTVSTWEGTKYSVNQCMIVE